MVSKTLTLHPQVIITQDIAKCIEMLEAQVVTERLVKVVEIEENFKLEHAKLAIEKAYLASKERTVVLLGATHFTPVIQNKLLKIIEEPPSNTDFILITHSKATILPTISSRLPVVVESHQKESKTIDLDLKNLTLASVFDFNKTHARLGASETKEMLEILTHQAMSEGGFTLDSATLTLFSDATKALNIGTPPPFVLNTILLKLLARKKR